MSVLWFYFNFLGQFILMTLPESFSKSNMEPSPIGTILLVSENVSQSHISSFPWRSLSQVFVGVCPAIWFNPCAALVFRSRLSAHRGDAISTPPLEDPQEASFLQSWYEPPRNISLILAATPMAMASGCAPAFSSPSSSSHVAGATTSTNGHPSATLPRRTRAG